MGNELKNKMSHRGQAMRQARDRWGPLLARKLDKFPT
jgi:inosine/xanthosine triphosphate pyrophosphatase family protein